jgi:acetate---CoA ligase (ADP-forming)
VNLGIKKMLEPSSVAIVGASGDPRKLTGMLLDFLRRSGYGGTILPVNPRYEELGGLRCYPSVAALPYAPDVAVIGVPGDAAVTSVRECADLGTGSVVMLTGGFGEGSNAAPEGVKRAAELAALCRERGVRMVGPNTTGIVNFAGSVPLTFADWYGRDRGLRGGVAVLAGSGTVGGLIFQSLQAKGVGVNYWIGLGNELDLDFADFVSYFAEQDSTDVLVCYIEGLADGQRFLRAAEAARHRGKHIVVLTAGHSDAARRSTLSHTGKLASSSAVYSGIFRQLGIIEVSSIEEAAYTTKALQYGLEMPDVRVGLMSASGGIGSLFTDQAEFHGLRVDSLPGEVRAELATVVPQYGSSDNPIDLSADVVFKGELLTGVLRVLDTARGVPPTWIVAGRATIDRYHESIARWAATAPVRTVICPGTALPPEIDQSLAANGLLVLDDSEMCMRTLGLVARERSWDRERPQVPPAGPRTASGRAADPVRVYDALLAHGIPLARSRFVSGEQELAALIGSGELRYPVAVKTAVAEIQHKSDVGCVVLGVTDAAGLAAAAAQVRGNAARAGVADPRLEIQEMAGRGTELLLAISPDKDFGAVATIAFGGVAVEVAPDSAHCAVPASADWYDAMLRQLRGFPLLTGFRGRAPADPGAIAQLMGKLWEFYAASDWVSEIELNPVIVAHADGRLAAVDALAGESAEA